MSELTPIQTIEIPSEPLRSGPSVRRGKSKQDYRTPDDFREAIIMRFGHPTFDLAADNSNRFAPPGKYLGPGGAAPDALVESWMGVTDGLNWLNPPFDQIAPWASRCRETSIGRYFPGILFLVPASVGSNWYRDNIHNQARVIFLNGRIHFDPENPTWGYPKDCMLVHFGAQPGFEVWNWKL